MSVNSQIVNSGLVFYYDTSNIKSYVGKPGTNVLTGITSWNGTVDTANYKIFDAVERVYIPKLQKFYDCRYVQIYNNDSANYCCPSLLQYGWPVTSGVAGNTLYTYSIIYKCASGYTHPNYMYHYEYGPSGYITEYGVFDTSKRTDLGSGWYHAWNTFTTNAATNTMYTGSWYYQYGVYDRYYVAAVNLIAGNYIIPPEQMLAPAETRSNTQGLLDLTRRNSINLASTTFNSTASIDFTGSSVISAGNIGSTFTNYTINCWFYSTSVTNYKNVFDMNYNTYNPNTGNVGPRLEQYSSGAIVAVWSGNTSNNSLYNSSNNISIAANTYYNFTWTCAAGTMKFYLNGKLQQTTSSAQGYVNSFADVNVGRGFILDGTRFFTGNIPVFAVYNTTLSDSEILQNFNATKGRFGL